MIPVYRPTLSGNEEKYLLECIRSGWISSKGKFVDRFEEGFSDFIKVRHSTSVSNGTVALHLALHVLGIKPGDEVIAPTLTYIASINAIAYLGATPVFVDSELKTWNIDVSKIEEKITKRTKAIMAVHLYGAPANMDALRGLCSKYGLFIIEDVAEAFGSKINGKFAGTLGDISTFSFFGNKTITTGEGGMITSNNEKFHHLSKYFKSQAVSPSREYWHDHIGFNYRMTNVCAAIGLAQLERAEEILAKKRVIASWYRRGLCDLPLVFQEEEKETVHSYWMVSILTESQFYRDRIRAQLNSAEIETRPIFYPAHVMPVFKGSEIFPIAEDISLRGINLPSFPDLSENQVDFICNKIRSCF